MKTNANLSAYAEKVYKHYSCQHLISIRIFHQVLEQELCAGCGMMLKKDTMAMLRVADHGHMIIYPNGMPCKCGNRGCWGYYTSAPNFISKLADQLNNY